MKSGSTLLAAVLPALLAAGCANAAAVLQRESFPEVSRRTLGASMGCDVLHMIFPSKLFYEGENVYNYEVAQFWSNTQLMSPKCIFRPTSALDISVAFFSTLATQSKYAVRGGGHMGIRVS
jgi:hypothetical protein